MTYDYRVWIVGKAKAVAFFFNNSEFTTARSLNLKKTRFFSIWVDRTSREAETWL
ncbi:hypothetical protein [Microcoleus sp. CAWBG58]|uniref:hypothetical protein n=1 Tax=Microcoleus sp. CAWBG58 TaxID=2841651 RepID=UPI0025F999A7|nr:hypothetical protein [Microcoleus sp. CAWBG58]